MHPIDIGPIAIEIKGDHPAAHFARREIDSVLLRPTVSDRNADTIFDFAGGAAPAAGRPIEGGRLFLRHRVLPTSRGSKIELRVRRGPLLYSVELPRDIRTAATCTVFIHFPEWSHALGYWFNPMARLLTKDGLSFHELVAKNFVYEILDPILWLRLLRRDATLVHASAVVDREDNVVLLAGSGGAGKSTTLLQLMLQDGWRYLGDDMVILARDGTCFRHPKHLQIYEYNLKLNDAWRARVMNRLSGWRRIWWRVRSKFLGEKYSRSRVDASDLFGSERVASTGRLKYMIWLGPDAPDDDSRIQRATPRLLAQRSSAALADELWSFLQLLNLSGLSIGGDTLVDDLMSTNNRIMESALKNVETFTVPSPAGPEELLALVRDIEDQLA